MFDKTQVRVGPSTIVSWIAAVGIAAIGVLASGQHWLLAVSAGLVALNNIARSYQAVYEPELFYATDEEAAVMFGEIDDPDEG